MASDFIINLGLKANLDMSQPSAELKRFEAARSATNIASALPSGSAGSRAAESVIKVINSGSSNYDPGQLGNQIQELVRALRSQYRETYKTERQSGSLPHEARTVAATQRGTYERDLQQVLGLFSGDMVAASSAIKRSLGRLDVTVLEKSLGVTAQSIGVTGDTFKELLRGVDKSGKGFDQLAKVTAEAAKKVQDSAAKTQPTQTPPSSQRARSAPSTAGPSGPTPGDKELERANRELANTRRELARSEKRIAPASKGDKTRYTYTSPQGETEEVLRKANRYIVRDPAGGSVSFPSQTQTQDFLDLKARLLSWVKDITGIKAAPARNEEAAKLVETIQQVPNVDQQQFLAEAIKPGFEVLSKKLQALLSGLLQPQGPPKAATPTTAATPPPATGRPAPAAAPKDKKGTTTTTSSTAASNIADAAQAASEGIVDALIGKSTEEAAKEVQKKVRDARAKKKEAKKARKAGDKAEDGEDKESPKPPKDGVGPAGDELSHSIGEAAQGFGDLAGVVQKYCVVITERFQEFLDSIPDRFKEPSLNLGEGSNELTPLGATSLYQTIQQGGDYALDTGTFGEISKEAGDAAGDVLEQLISQGIESLDQRVEVTKAKLDKIELPSHLKDPYIGTQDFDEERPETTHLIPREERRRIHDENLAQNPPGWDDSESWADGLGAYLGDQFEDARAEFDAAVGRPRSGVRIGDLEYDDVTPKTIGQLVAHDALTREPGLITQPDVDTGPVVDGEELKARLQAAIDRLVDELGLTEHEVSSLREGFSEIHQSVKYSLEDGVDYLDRPITTPEEAIAVHDDRLPDGKPFSEVPKREADRHHGGSRRSRTFNSVYLASAELEPEEQGIIAGKLAQVSSHISEKDDGDIGLFFEEMHRKLRSILPDGLEGDAKAVEQGFKKFSDLINSLVADGQSLDEAIANATATLRSSGSEKLGKLLDELGPKTRADGRHPRGGSSVDFGGRRSTPFGTTRGVDATHEDQPRQREDGIHDEIASLGRIAGKFDSGEIDPRQIGALLADLITRNSSLNQRFDPTESHPFEDDSTIQQLFNRDFFDIPLTQNGERTPDIVDGSVQRDALVGFREFIEDVLRAIRSGQTQLEGVEVARASDPGLFGVRDRSHLTDDDVAATQHSSTSRSGRRQARYERHIQSDFAGSEAPPIAGLNLSEIGAFLASSALANDEYSHGVTPPDQQYNRLLELKDRVGDGLSGYSPVEIEELKTAFGEFLALVKTRLEQGMDLFDVLGDADKAFYELHGKPIAEGESADREGDLSTNNSRYVPRTPTELGARYAGRYALGGDGLHSIQTADSVETQENLLDYVNRIKGTLGLSGSANQEFKAAFLDTFKRIIEAYRDGVSQPEAVVRALGPSKDKPLEVPDTVPDTELTPERSPKPPPPPPSRLEQLDDPVDDGPVDPSGTWIWDGEKWTTRPKDTPPNVPDTPREPSPFDFPFDENRRESISDFGRTVAADFAGDEDPRSKGYAARAKKYLEELAGELGFTAEETTHLKDSFQQFTRLVRNAMKKGASLEEAIALAEQRLEEADASGGGRSGGSGGKGTGGGGGGPSGPSGPSGAGGSSGPSGPSGPSGASGPSGVSGASASGPSGPAPSPGSPGGPSGPSGPRRTAGGPSGPSGPSGSSGPWPPPFPPPSPGGWNRRPPRSGPGASGPPLDKDSAERLQGLRDAVRVAETLQNHPEFRELMARLRTAEYNLGQQVERALLEMGEFLDHSAEMFSAKRATQGETSGRAPDLPEFEDDTLKYYQGRGYLALGDERVRRDPGLLQTDADLLQQRDQRRFLTRSLLNGDGTPGTGGFQLANNGLLLRGEALAAEGQPENIAVQGSNTTQQARNALALLIQLNTVETDYAGLLADQLAVRTEILAKVRGQIATDQAYLDSKADLELAKIEEKAGVDTTLGTPSAQGGKLEEYVAGKIEGEKGKELRKSADLEAKSDEAVIQQTAANQAAAKELRRKTRSLSSDIEADAQALIAKRQYDAQVRERARELAREGENSRSGIRRFFGGGDGGGPGSPGGGGGGGGGGFGGGGRFGGGAAGFFAGGLASTIKYAVPSAALYGSVRTIKEMISVSEELDLQLGLLDDQFTQTFGDQAANQIGKVREQVLKLSTDLGISAEQLAKVAKQIYAAFGTGIELSTSLDGETNKISGEKLARDQLDVVGGLSKITGSTPDEISDQTRTIGLSFGVTNRVIADVVASAQQSSSIPAGDLVKGLSDNGTVFKDAGYTIAEATAFLAEVIKRSGSRGISSVSESLNRVLPIVQKDRVQLLELAQTTVLGNDPKYKTAIAGSDTQGILDAIGRHYDKLDKAHQQQVNELLGGPKAARDIIPVLQNQQGISDLTKDIENGDGSYDRLLKLTKEKLSTQLERLTTAFQRLALEIFDAGVGDALSRLASFAIEAASLLGKFAKILTEVNERTGGLLPQLLALYLGLRAMKVAGQTIARVLPVIAGFGALGGGGRAGGTAFNLPPGVAGPTIARNRGFFNPLTRNVAAPVGAGAFLPAGVAGLSVGGAAAAVPFAAVALTLAAYGQSKQESSRLKKEFAGFSTKDLIREQAKDTGIGTDFNRGLATIFGEDTREDIIGRLLKERQDSYASNKLNDQGIYDFIQNDEGALKDKIVGAFNVDYGNDFLFSTDPLEPDNPLDAEVARVAALRQFAQSAVDPVKDHGTLGDLVTVEAAKIYEKTVAIGDPSTYAEQGYKLNEDGSLYVDDGGKSRRDTGQTFTGSLRDVIEDPKFNGEDFEVDLSTLQNLKVDEDAYKEILDIAADNDDSRQKAAQSLIDGLVAAYGTTETGELDIQAARDAETTRDEKAAALDKFNNFLATDGKNMETALKEFAGGRRSAGSLSNKFRETRALLEEQIAEAIALGNTNPEAVEALAELDKKSGEFLANENKRAQALIASIYQLSTGRSELGALELSVQQAVDNASNQYLDMAVRQEAAISIPALLQGTLAQKISRGRNPREQLAAGKRGVVIDDDVREQIILARAGQFDYSGLGLDAAGASIDDQIQAALKKGDIQGVKNILQQTQAAGGPESGRAGFILEQINAIDIPSILKPTVEQLEDLEKANRAFERQIYDGKQQLLDVIDGFNASVRGKGNPQANYEDKRKQIKRQYDNLQKNALALFFEGDYVGSQNYQNQAAGKFTELIELERSNRDRIRSEIRSRGGLTIAALQASGDTVAAAQEAMRQAQDELNYALANPSDFTPEEVDAKRGDLIAKQAGVRDSVYAKQKDDIAFGLEMETITKKQAINQLLGLRKIYEDNETITRDIDRQIKSLEDAANSALNLPDKLKLPTLYEARRLDQSITPQGSPGGYQDNRQVDVKVYVTSGMSPADVTDAVSRAVGADRRTGYYDGKY